MIFQVLYPLSNIAFDIAAQSVSDIKRNVLDADVLNYFYSLFCVDGFSASQASIRLRQP